MGGIYDNVFHFLLSFSSPELFSGWAFCGACLVRLRLLLCQRPTTLEATFTAQMVFVCRYTFTIPMQRYVWRDTDEGGAGRYSDDDGDPSESQGWRKVK